MLTCVGNWVTRYYWAIIYECCHDQLDIFVAKLANHVFVGQE